jgi:hypothetical protein
VSVACEGRARDASNFAPLGARNGLDAQSKSTHACEACAYRPGGKRWSHRRHIKQLTIALGSSKEVLDSLTRREADLRATCKQIALSTTRLSIGKTLITSITPLNIQRAAPIFMV